MRHARPVLLALILALACAPCALAKRPAPGSKTAKAAPAQAGGERIAISGRVAVGLDKAFIKDQALGYLMVQGTDLTRHAGRRIEAKGQVAGREQDCLVVRLLEYRVINPDDDSPGAGGAVRQGGREPDTPARAKAARK